MNTSMVARWPLSAPTNCWNVRSAHGVRPPLGLHVDEVQSKLVFANDAVDAAVSAATESLGSILPRAAGADCAEDIENHVLEEVWRLLADPPEQLGGERDP